MTSLTLAPEGRSVGRARKAVRDALHLSGALHMLDAAQLAVSELVTNSVIHAATQVEMRILAGAKALRVELADGSAHLPVRRSWATTAGTGRGLHIVDECVDRWDTQPAAEGKTVWFEIGEECESTDLLHAEGPPGADPDGTVRVMLQDAPLLMHWAWQEHATSLLREHLLYTVDEDPEALADHALGCEALRILDEQLPTPTLPADPDALIAESVEPGVTAEVTLRLRQSSVSLFAVLDDLLSRAVAEARAGHLLAPPTQPEIVEMREWLCGQIADQAAGTAAPTPWRARTDVRAPLDEDAAGHAVFRQLADSEEPVIAMNEASVIVSVARPVLDFLGYRRESSLLGRRILVIIPSRFHQAHIAGTTLHAANGRDALLEEWITAPVVRADGHEVPVEFRVERRLLGGDRPVFLATFNVPSGDR